MNAFIRKKNNVKNRRSSIGSAHQSLLKSHRTRIVSDLKLDMLSETLNVRKK